MWNGFIGDLIRRTNQRALITAIVLLVFVGLFFGYNRGYFLGFFAGPHAITPQQLAAAKSPSDFPNRFALIGKDSAENSVEPTSVEEIADDHGRSYVKARFILAVIGGHRMFVRMAPDDVTRENAPNLEAATSFTGQLKSVADIPQGSGYIASDVLPLYLDTYDYKTFGYGWLAVGVPVLLLAAWLLWRWWQASSDFSRHPICRQLAAQGQLELLVQQIDTEMAAPHLTVSRRAEAAHVTQHWLVISSFLGGSVMQLTNVMWIYRSLIKRRVYFVITVSKRHVLNVQDRFGKKAAIQLSDAKAQDLYEHLRNVTPGAVHGFDKRLPALWSRTPDKTGFPAAAAAMLSGQPLLDQRVTNQYGA